MQPTTYPEVNELIDILFSRIQFILGDRLVGFYLEGSLVMGDFDPKTSDIDMTAAVSTGIDDREFEALHKMHDDFTAEHPRWEDRIEVCYISVDGLGSVRSYTGPIVNISPGEPFHRLKARKEWIMNWYLIREKSKTLFGPPAKTMIEPISKEEFLQGVKDHARSWDQWVLEMKNRYAQSYAILTMCRALYAYQHGDQVSKVKAAQWALKELPEWAGVIQNAVSWKQAGVVNEPDEANFPKTVQFVNDVRGLILNG